MRFKNIVAMMALCAVLSIGVAAHAATITFEFEGEGNLTAADSALSFTSVSGTAFADSPVPYAAVNDSTALTATNPSSGGDNEWLVRGDWDYNGGSPVKTNDPPVGVLQSGNFFVDASSVIEFELAGGTPQSDDRWVGVTLRDASDDSEIIREVPAASGTTFIPKSWSNIVGSSTEVYITIEDNNAGGWGFIGVDNFVLTNVEEVPEPSTGLLLSMGLSCLLMRRRRRR